MDKIYTLDSIVEFNDIPWLSRKHFWRMNKMTIRQLLFDILQLEDRESLKALINLTGMDPLIKEIPNFNIKFRVPPFQGRYLRLRNYLLLLKDLQNWQSLTEKNKKNLEFFTGPLSNRDLQLNTLKL